MDATADGNGWQHTTVLLVEAVDALLTDRDGIYVDGTFGRGGHSRRLLDALAPGGPRRRARPRPAGGRCRGADRRPALHRSTTPASPSWPTSSPRSASRTWTACCSTWACRARRSTTPRAASASVSTVRWTCAWTPTRGESAAQFLARADERQIAEVIRDYGEERFAVQIAKALVARREGGLAVRTTAELSEVVARAVKTREAGQDPATRTFQALRIFVNAELEELEQGLNAALALLRPGGRLVVISFHSLEDRIVKTFIAREARRCSTAARRSPSRRRCACTRSRASSPAPPRCAPTRARARRSCAWPSAPTRPGQARRDARRTSCCSSR